MHLHKIYGEVYDFIWNTQNMMVEHIFMIDYWSQPN